MITYEIKNKEKVKVILDGKHAGDILKDEKGWRYKVARARVFGKYFPTVEEVKASLED